MKFQEPNNFNVQKGDYVLVALPHPENISTEEICKDWMHTGEVLSVYHNENGALRIVVEGLDAKFGREWTWQNNVSVIDKSKNSIFETEEPTIDITTFDLRTAENRNTVAKFRGEFKQIGRGEFEVYSYDSGNSYIVKIQKTFIHSFRVTCTCVDFDKRKRVCKHIAHIFNTDRRQAERIAA